MPNINQIVLESFDQAIRNVTPNSSSGISTIERKYNSVDRSTISNSNNKPKMKAALPSMNNGTTVATSPLIAHKPKPKFGLGSGKSLNGW